MVVSTVVARCRSGISVANFSQHIQQVLTKVPPGLSHVGVKPTKFINYCCRRVLDRRHVPIIYCLLLLSFLFLFLFVFQHQYTTWRTTVVRELERGASTYSYSSPRPSNAARFTDEFVVAILRLHMHAFDTLPRRVSTLPPGHYLLPSEAP